MKWDKVFEDKLKVTKYDEYEGLMKPDLTKHSLVWLIGVYLSKMDRQPVLVKVKCAKGKILIERVNK